MDSALDPKCSMVVLICGSQMGKTEGLLMNLIGCCVHVHRKPVMYVAPTRDLTESISESRFQPMLALTPELSAGLIGKKHQTRLETYLYGARVGFAWAGSPSQLSAREAMLVLVDERDRMKILKADGDPLVLSKARTATYANHCVVAPSTPTLGDIKTEWDAQSKVERWRVTDQADVRSPIWRAWQGGTRHEWTTPCPRCGFGFVLRRSGLKYDDRAPLDEIEQMAHVECPTCHKRIEPREQRKLAKSGRYLAPGQEMVEGEVVGDPPGGRTRSYWVSGLHSPWISWGRRASDYEKSRRDGNIETTQAVVNVDFGECWALTGERPTEADIYARRGDYKRGEVPDWVSLLIGAVDIGSQELWWLVRGFGPNGRSALIDYGMIVGPTRDPEGVPEAWEELDDYMTRDHGGLKIQRVGVDSGFSQNAAYTWCRAHRQLYWPLRGSRRLNRNFMQTPIDLHPYTKKPLPNSVLLTTFGVTRIKQTIFSKIDPRGAKLGEAGSWELPSDIDAEYVDHMRAEEAVDMGGGEIKYVRHSANHWLDGEVYCVGILESLRKGRAVKSRAEENRPAAPVRRRGFRRM